MELWVGLKVEMLCHQLLTAELQFRQIELVGCFKQQLSFRQGRRGLQAPINPLQEQVHGVLIHTGDMEGKATACMTSRVGQAGEAMLIKG